MCPVGCYKKGTGLYQPKVSNIGCHVVKRFLDASAENQFPTSLLLCVLFTYIYFLTAFDISELLKRYPGTQNNQPFLVEKEERFGYLGGLCIAALWSRATPRLSCTVVLSMYSSDLRRTCRKG